MIAAGKLVSVVVMLVVPGALLIAGAWVLARLLAHQLQQHRELVGRQRLARAVASVRWRDVVREARALVR